MGEKVGVETVGSDGVGGGRDRAVGAPVATAIACSVSVEPTVIGPAYWVEEWSAWCHWSCSRSVAPDVASEMRHRLRRRIGPGSG